MAWSLQRLKSSLAKPVVVMIDSVWNSDVRTAASNLARHLREEGPERGRDGGHLVAVLVLVDAGIESDELPLSFAIGGRRCGVDRGEVLRKLLRRWDRHRALPDLKTTYRQAFVLPPGKPRALTLLAPLGPQLPRVYGLAAPGKPDTPAAARVRLLELLAETFERDARVRRDGERARSAWRALTATILRALHR